MGSVISDGECDVLDNQDRRVATLYRGDFFGEELLTGDVAHTKVLARTFS